MPALAVLRAPAGCFRDFRFEGGMLLLYAALLTFRSAKLVSILLDRHQHIDVESCAVSQISVLSIDAQIIRQRSGHRDLHTLIELDVNSKTGISMSPP